VFAAAGFAPETRLMVEAAFDRLIREHSGGRIEWVGVRHPSNRSLLNYSTNTAGKARAPTEHGGGCPVPAPGQPAQRARFSGRLASSKRGLFFLTFTTLRLARP
jgi:hypothetical protein